MTNIEPMITSSDLTVTYSDLQCVSGVSTDLYAGSGAICPVHCVRAEGEVVQLRFRQPWQPGVNGVEEVNVPPVDSSGPVHLSWLVEYGIPCFRPK